MRYYITNPAILIPSARAVAADFLATEVHSYGANGTDFPHVEQTVYGYFEAEKEVPSEIQTNLCLLPGPTPRYYPISEDAARRAKAAYSFSDYVEGSATESYRREVDKASYLAYRQKQRVDPMHHEKIDRLLDSFARRLAENTNATNNNTAKVPSVMIAGGSNFPVQAKKKQNARDDTLRGEWHEIMGLLDKIKSVGTGGISSDDPDAIKKLEAKLEKLEKHQELMKAANAAVRLKNTEEGDRRLRELGFIDKEITELRKPDLCGRVGYPSYELSNNNANIRRIKERIEELKKRNAAPAPAGWRFYGGTVAINTEINRLQVIFDDKPDAETREQLKSEGFRWAPSQGAWQRQYTENALRAARRCDCLKPIEDEV